MYCESKIIIRKIINRMENGQQTFIARRLDSTLEDHTEYVRSYAYHVKNKKFSVHKISPNFQSRKCGTLVIRNV
jgi:uncharacterized membrane-anchored protein